MGISYCITVCNEYEEVQKLISKILVKRNDFIEAGDDNIIVLLDKPNCPPNLLGYLYDLSSDDYITLIEDTFKGNFAEWKNKFFEVKYLKDYLFFIDADEYPSDSLILNIDQIIELNPDVEIFGVPRINKVSDITQEHLTKWRWSIDELRRINYPDYQYRIVKKDSNVKWVGKVHERPVSSGIKAELPMNVDIDLHHYKTINKQESQNKLYAEL